MVFISYSHKDEVIVKNICKYLEDNGIKCFVAYRDIPVGVPFADIIPDAIHESEMMIAVFSHDFNHSDHVAREIQMMAEDKKPIITFKLTDEKMKGSKEYYLSNLNWINAFNTPENHFQTLLISVENLAMDTDSQTHNIEKYFCGIGVDVNINEAFKWVRTSAFRGNSNAQYLLNRMYLHGIGVEKDLVQAFHWNYMAAMQKNISALHQLSWRYSEGIGTSVDDEKSSKWYFISKMLDDVERYREFLGNVYVKVKSTENPEKSCEYLLDYAKNNGVKDSLVLAVVHKLTRSFFIGNRDDEEIEKSIVRAIECCKNLAEQGNAKAQYLMGELCCFDKPDGDITYLEWFEKSAMQGYTPAKWSLGVHYEDIDDNKSGKWLVEAVEDGYPGALGYLTTNWDESLGVEKNKVVELALTAAINGDSEAQLQLGCMYEEGIFVKKNLDESIKWHRKAAEQNNSSSESILGRMYETGTGVEKDIDKALAWYCRSFFHENDSVGDKIHELTHNLSSASS